MVNDVDIWPVTSTDLNGSGSPCTTRVKLEYDFNTERNTSQEKTLYTGAEDQAAGYTRARWGQQPVKNWLNGSANMDEISYLDKWVRYLTINIR